MKQRKSKVGEEAKEHEEQVILVNWLKVYGVPFFAIPNGRKTTMATMMYLKAEGLSKGVPDLFIPVPLQNDQGDVFHGVFIEMKRKKGGIVSPEQTNWLNLLTATGYIAMVCRGAQEAIDMLTILGLNKLNQKKIIITPEKKVGLEKATPSGLILPN